MEAQAVALKALLTGVREGIGEQARRRSLSLHPFPKTLNPQTLKA